VTPGQEHVCDLSIDLELMIRLGAFDGAEEYCEEVMGRLDRISEVAWVLEMTEC
jgi:hypothetical protein